MQSVRVFENITFFSLFTNRLRQFRDFNHHTVTSINHLFLFSSETWDAALSSISLSELRAYNDFCIFRWQFKILSHCWRVCCISTCIWSCHVIVRYNLFCLFAYSAEHRKSFFCYFRRNNFGCRTFGASLIHCFISNLYYIINTVGVNKQVRFVNWFIFYFNYYLSYYIFVISLFVLFVIQYCICNYAINKYIPCLLI